MRKQRVVGVLAAAAIASTTVFACADDGAPAPTSTAVVDPTPADRPVEEDWSAPLDIDPRISEQVVEAILPTPEESSAALGLAPSAWFLETDLGQEFEGFDFRDSGMTAGWVARFVPVQTPAAGDPLEGMFLSLAFHNTAEDAERTYRYVGGMTGVQRGEERGTIADAVSLVTGYPPDAPTTSGIIIRHRTVTASVVLLRTVDRDVRAGLREFARLLAQGIDEFVRTQKR